ncbi:hypothetical protein SUSAZ_09375 [Sulfolobus acidocaldarius SUSAZ]|nr:hypothetical protein SUSAZ_09375 [Sulfolobus acidocaldarius SUSAZ]
MSSHRKVRNHALYVVGIMSYVVSLIPFYNLNFFRTIILIPILAYTLPILEHLQPKVMVLKLSKVDYILIILASIPYLFIKQSILLILPISLILLTFALYYFRNTMWGNVLGTTFLSSLSIVWNIFVYNSFLLPSLYWILYILVGALYVEYKIPFRKLSKGVVQEAWVISVIILVFLSLYVFKVPLLLLSLIEPSLRFIRPGQKLGSMKELARLGKKGVKRDSLFIALLSILSIIWAYQISVINI